MSTLDRYDLVAQMRAIREANKASQAETDKSKAVDESLAVKDGSYKDLERARSKADIATIKQKNIDLKVNRKLRWKYANRVFCYLVLYSLFVALLVVADGFSIFSFDLADIVLLTLVGSTAAAAIGLVFAVTNGLFEGVGKK